MSTDTVCIIVRGSGCVFQTRASQQAIFTAIRCGVDFDQLVEGVQNVQIVECGAVNPLNRDPMIGAVPDGQICNGDIVSLYQDSEIVARLAAEIQDDIVAVAS